MTNNINYIVTQILNIKLTILIIDTMGSTKSYNYMDSLAWKFNNN